MAYCIVPFKCSHRRLKHNLFTEKTTFYCPVNNFPLKKKTMYNILVLCETSGNFSPVAESIRNLHPHSNYWFFNLKQNNFKHTIEQISKQQLPKAHWGHSKTRSKPTERHIWPHQEPMRDVLHLHPHFPSHSVKWNVLVKVMPTALTNKPQISVA